MGDPIKRDKPTMREQLTGRKAREFDITQLSQLIELDEEGEETKNQRRAWELENLKKKERGY